MTFITLDNKRINNNCVLRAQSHKYQYSKVESFVGSTNSYGDTIFLPAGNIFSSRSQDPLVAPLPEEALHPLHPGRRRPALPVPLEFVHIFPEHVSSPQSRDQVIKFSLVLMSVKDKGMFYM